MSETIYIYNTGMITSIGFGTKQTSASARANISRTMDSEFYGKDSEPLGMSLLNDALLPKLHSDLQADPLIISRTLREVQLSSIALKDLAKNATGLSDIPVYLGVHEQLSEYSPPCDESFIDYLSTQSEINFNTNDSKLFPLGKAAGLMALEAAIKDIKDRKFDQIIVGGAETYCDSALLGFLVNENRVRVHGISDGFIPGEGAAFIIVGSGDKTENKLAKIDSIGTGFENGHLYSEEPYQGDGLAEAFTNCFGPEDEPTNKVKTVFAGFNGENFNAKEWGVAFLRHEQFFDANYAMNHPVESFGDPGAALGIIMIGMVVNGFTDTYINSPCLIWCSSDKGSRGAVLISDIT